MTVEYVAGALMNTVRSVRRWESGATNPRQRELRNLINLFDVSDELARELEVLAKEGRQPGWWTPYTSDIRPTYATFLGLEAEAAQLLDYAAILIPGPLQTEKYMRAVMNAATPMLSDETIDSRIEVRLKRQSAMLSSGHLTHFVIDEGCLWRCVGGKAVMREQLDYLIVAAEARLITIQVLPLTVGAHASILGSFSVLTYASDEDPPVAYVEMLGGDLYADGSDSAQYSDIFSKLCQAALPEPLALDLIERVKGEAHRAN